jgi:molybdate transport system substrate-binding protein
MLIRRVLAVAALTFGFSVAAAQADTVTVFAAASLTNALTEVGEAFAAKTGHTVKPSYAASAALARQIEQGAPAQVFVSADPRWTDHLAGRKLINPDTRFNLLGNSIVLVAPTDSQLAKVDLGAKTDVAALAGAGRIATGNPDTVPAGTYFRQAMERSGQWARVAPKIASADSVRAALAFVERGEAPLGAVFGTDAAGSAKVKVVGVFPGAMHDPIVYPFALVAGNETPAARAFLDFVRTDAAKGVFVRHGFKVN